MKVEFTKEEVKSLKNFLFIIGLVKSPKDLDWKTVQIKARMFEKKFEG